MKKKDYKRIVFVFNQWPSERMVDSSGIRYLERLNYKIEIWMMNARHVYNNVSSSDPLISKNSIRIFHFYKKYEQYVRKAVSDSIFVVASGLPAAIMYPICSARGKYIIEGERRANPNREPLLSYTNSITDGVKDSFISRLFRMGIGFFILRQLDWIWVFAANIYEKKHSDYLTDQCPPITIFDATSFIFSNRTLPYRPDLKPYGFSCVPSVEYNDFLMEERKHNDIKEEIILFAGGAIGFPLRGTKDVEIVHERIYDPHENQRYRQEVELLLDKLEQHYNMPAIIAAHPGVNYGDYDFGGRQIIYGCTCELAKRCKVYVLIYSRSVAYPLLWNKEILLYNNDALIHGIMWENFGKSLAEELNKEVLNISDLNQMKEPWKFASEVIEENRESFLRKYVRNSESKDFRIYGEILNECLMNQ